jgi:uncharacterized protein (UPF0332 family)
VTSDGVRIVGLMAKAERDLEFASRALDISPEQAARMGYMAVFHSALAVVRAATGTEPRTHTGLRSVFGELALKEASLGTELGSFLAKSYESKDIADYQTEYVVDRRSADLVVAGATHFVAKVKAHLRERFGAL